MLGWLCQSILTRGVGACVSVRVYEHAYEGARAHVAPNTSKCTAVLMQRPHAARPSNTANALLQGPPTGKTLRSAPCLVQHVPAAPPALWRSQRGAVYLPWAGSGSGLSLPGPRKANTRLCQLRSPSVRPSPAGPSQGFGRKPGQSLRSCSSFMGDVSCCKVVDSQPEPHCTHWQAKRSNS